MPSRKTEIQCDMSRKHVTPEGTELLGTFLANMIMQMTTFHEPTHS